MAPMTVNAQRALNEIEREVVSHEFTQSARGLRYFGWFLGGAAVFVTSFVLEVLAQGAWLTLPFVVLFAASCGFMSYTLLKRRVTPAPLELEALSVHALCSTRRHGKHSYPYVGPCRVVLRSGWQAFWPEGKSVEVELCLPPSNIGKTWVDASLVSLPGIDITTWHAHPPPKPYVWLMMGAILSGMAALMLTLVLTLDSYWPRAASGLCNLGQRTEFQTVGELLRTPRANGARVTIARGHWVHVLDHGDYLCELHDDWAGGLTTAVSPAVEVEERHAPQAPADAELARDERLANEVANNPENPCLLADPAYLEFPDERPPVVAATDEVGVLTAGLIWRHGAPGPNLKPLLLLIVVGAIAVTTISRTIWRARRYSAELDAWTKAVGRR